MTQLLQHRIICWSLSLIIASISFVFGLPASVNAQSISNTHPTQIATVSASEAFRNAYNQRYTWDKNFPGYSAEVSITHRGDIDQGIVRVQPDLSVDVINVEPDNLRELVANTVKMEIIHRRRLPFEQLHGNNDFELKGKDEYGALKINQVGDNSYYKVKGDVITQVNRSFGDVAVTVDTLGTTKTPEGYLVSHFKTTFRDAQTDEVLEKEDVRDFHEKVGNYYLLTNRTIRYNQAENPEKNPVADTRIRFNDIQPL